MLRSLIPLVVVPCCAVAVVAQNTGEQDSGGWWAWQPLVRPAVPSVSRTDWQRSPIDAFVLVRLERDGLAPAALADRHTLLRRVTYDLTGLPPSDAEIAAFVGDTTPDAYEQVVDRLLRSPQYGVKWAQHWLDVVRYAETDGYERDSQKPFVWRYRDWVVDALNADMPYGEFVTAQLAGDELPGATVQDQIATGYYRLGIWDDEPTDREQHLYDVYDGIADTTARATLAISMGCARCHDHKKDPLPARDYYAFLACFENVTPYDKQPVTVAAGDAQQKYERAWQRYEAKLRSDQTSVLRFSWLSQLSAFCRDRGKADTSLVACYRHRAGQASATQLLDEVGGHHAAVTGQIVEVPPAEGGGFRFDGDDHAEVPALVHDSFTVSLRVRSKERGPAGGSDAHWHRGAGLLDAEVNGVLEDWGIAWLDDGVVVAGVGNPDVSLRSQAGLHDGLWHHVAFTRDMTSGRIALYVDGRRCGEAIAATTARRAPDTFVIGVGRSNGQGFRGDLDHIRVFSRAMTASEVVALWLDAPGGIAVAADLDEICSATVRSLVERQPPSIDTVEVLAVRERGRRAKASFVRQRGNVHAPGAEVDPGVPTMLAAAAPSLGEALPTATSTGRRLALAKWITSPDNGLAWRVISNRLWQHHFGRGLVRSSNDFGHLGELPTHPQLLDWLACELRDGGGRWKSMHRLLVTSATYRMASTAAAEALARDPQNDAFWRFPRRRLTAEEVRDSMLASNGTLNLERSGPSVFPPLPQAVLLTASRPDDAWGTSPPDQAVRRSLYVHVKRSLPEPLLASFDRADTDASCPVRFATVQPTQALTMINGEFANREAELLARRLEREATGLDARLRRGLELVTQRPARDDDAARLLQLAVDMQREFGRSEHEALQRCCLLLLNCNEFLFLD